MGVTEIETWRPVRDFADSYEVSSLGRVRSVARVIINERGRWGCPMRKQLQSRELKHWITNSGYREITLGAGRGRKRYIHRLVAEAFIQNPDDKHEINHIDGDRANNSSVNLEWMTHRENCQHAHSVLGHRGGQFGPNRIRYPAGAYA